MAFLSHSQLRSLGLKTFGENVLISDKASIYGASRISLGSNVRIDDFCVLSAGEGGIEIGSFVHLAVGVTLIGASRIRLDDFSGLSAKCSVFSSSDDFSGSYLTNPTVPIEYTNVKSKPVHFEKHTIIGAHAVILPGVTVEEGAAVGANALVTRNVSDWSIYAGQPAKRICARKKDLLLMEKALLSGNY